MIKIRKTFAIFHIRLALNCLTLLSLGLMVGTYSARAGISCPASHCLYLPLVSSPLPVQVTRIESFNWFGEVLRVTGEVLNISDAPVYEVEVEISAYDSSNQLVGTVSGSTVLTATLPGQLNLFDLVSDIPSDSYNLVAEISNVSLTSTQVYIAPTIIMTDVQIIFNGYTVQGEIRNDYDFPLTNVKGWSWTLDQLTSIFPRNIIDYLAPDATASFSWTVNNVYTTPSPPVRIVIQGIAEP